MISTDLNAKVCGDRLAKMNNRKLTKSNGILNARENASSFEKRLVRQRERAKNQEKIAPKTLHAKKHSNLDFKREKVHLQVKTNIS